MATHSTLEAESPLSPYYIHPSESPSLVLVSELLTGNNYHSWSRSIKMALQSKNKLSFIDGSISSPSKDNPLFQIWQRCNTLVHSWLLHSVSPSIAQSVIWIDEACDVWKDLQDRFAQGDQFRLSDLQEEIYCYRQGSLSVTEYFTKLKILWDEFFNLRPIPKCSCDPSCSCGAIDVVRQYMNNDFVIKFLRGLNDSFNTVKSQIMLIDPLPPINKVFSMVVQHERQSAHYDALNVSQLHNTVVNRSQSQAYRRFSQQRQRPLCSFCGLLGHTIDKCYKKHGYPPGYKQNSRNSGTNLMTGQVNAVQQFSHLDKDIRFDP